jgi:hypothetical protein
MTYYTTQDLEEYITLNGLNYITLGGDEPLYFQVLRSIRMELRDPAGVNDIVYAETLPASGDPGLAYYHNGDGKYYRWSGLLDEWEVLLLKVSDAYIRQMTITHGNRGILFLIDYLIAGLNTGAVSFSAGAESVHLPSLKDLLDFYRAMRQAKEAELSRAAGTNTGRIFRTPKRPIGGVMEGW